MEFALVLPVLLALIFGLIEFGRAMFIRASLQFAVEDAARCLALNLPSCDKSDLSKVKTYAAGRAMGMTISTSHFAADPAAACGAKVTASYAFSSIVPLVPLNVTLQAKSCRPALP